MHRDTGVTSHRTQAAGLVPPIFVCVNAMFLVDSGAALCFCPEECSKSGFECTARAHTYMWLCKSSDLLKQKVNIMHLCAGQFCSLLGGSAVGGVCGALALEIFW